MAFSTQFAVSYELSRLVPVAPIINLGSRALLELVRDFQSSGSNLVTEQDLAEVFGRSYIDTHFASTFKTAVNKSNIQRLAGIVEIVLEVGAGPTVQHAVKDAPFFSMVVQLSLLLWAHNVTSLATSLALALELRSTDIQKSLPTYSQLIGTLRCIQQQTSGFLWELQFSAVDAILSSKLEIDTTNGRDRTVPHVILRTLVDALPAVQRFPENHFLAVQTRSGITTLVVWIHQVLGLTMELQSSHDVLRLGHGVPSISIDCRDQGLTSTTLPSVTLFNEVKDVVFQASVDPLDDPILNPMRRHTLEGYGLSYLHYFRGDVRRSKIFVQRFIQSCLQIAQRQRDSQALGPSGPSNEEVPSEERILAVGRIIFPLYRIPDGSLTDSSSSQLEPQPVTMPPKFEQELTHIFFAFAMVNNLEECKHVPLNVGGLQKFIRYSAFGVKTPREAFHILATLLLDQAPEQEYLDRAAVISCWGWSLCISSILSEDPGDLHADFAIKQGVPARFKERKEWIMDHASGLTWLHSLTNEEDLGYEVVARSGDDNVRTKSFMKHSSVKYLVGTTDTAFQVFTMLTCSHKLGRSDYAYIRLGFRYMQDLYWNASPLLECDHHVSEDEGHTVLDHCYVFRGLLERLSLEILEQHRKPLPILTRNMSQQNATDTKNSSATSDALQLTAQRSPTTTRFDTSQVQSSPVQSNDMNPQSLVQEAPFYPTKWREKVPALRTLPSITNFDNLSDRVYRVHISQSAGNIAVRWILLAQLQSYLRDDKQRLFETCYLKGKNCCTSCALQYIEDDYNRRSHPLMTFNGASTIHVALIS